MTRYPLLQASPDGLRMYEGLMFLPAGGEPYAYALSPQLLSQAVSPRAPPSGAGGPGGFAKRNSEILNTLLGSGVRPESVHSMMIEKSSLQLTNIIMKRSSLGLSLYKSLSLHSMRP